MMNRKVLISIIIIAVLALLLIIGRRERAADVPEIEPWEGEAEEIIIQKKDDARIRMLKKDDRWVLNTEEYPADAQAVSKIEKAIRDLVITDLISEKPHYLRYGLEAKALRVTAKKEGAVVRDLLIGKKSSTHRHTYIRFPDRPEIYLASGNLVDTFDKPIDDLRDKEIFKVTPKGVESFQLNYGGRRLTFVKVKEKAEEDTKEAEREKKSEDDGVKKKEKEQERWVCEEYKQIPIDEGAVNTIVNSFNPLKADGFTSLNKDSLKSPRCVVTVKAYQKNITLSIFGTESGKEDRYLCTSSESPYVFALKKWSVERYFKKLEDFKKK